VNYRSISFSKKLFLLVPVLIAALWLWRGLRGPEMPGYQIQLQPLVQTVVATGRVISTSRAQVGSEITGTVRERRVKEGDAVQPGDVLVVLRSDDLAARVREAEAAVRQLQTASRPQAQAALVQASAQHVQAVRERQRRADLFARQLIARETLEQAEQAEIVARSAEDRARLAAAASAAGGNEEQQLRERLAAARAQLAKTTIRAEVAGIVLTRNAEPVQPGRVLFEIARGDTEIEVLIDEKNLAVLVPGQTAQCIADAYPVQVFAATVNYLAPSVDPQRGTVNTRLRVDPAPAFLRQDMTVSVNIETGRREQALVVPNDAIVGADRGVPTVLAVRKGRLQRVSVTLGMTSLAMSEVTAGLAAGDQVLAAAAMVTSIDAGARVRISVEALPTVNGGNATRGETPVRFD
jgi:HlyD family secretion protein